MLEVVAWLWRGAWWFQHSVIRSVVFGWQVLLEEVWHGCFAMLGIEILGFFLRLG